MHPMYTFAAFRQKKKNEINRPDWLVGWQVGVFIVLVVGKDYLKRVETVLKDLHIRVFSLHLHY